MRRLNRVIIEGLLGRFDHNIHFDENWEFIILHGPNGVGKTRILEIINDTFRGRITSLSNAPFQQAIFHFDDLSILKVSKLLPTLDSEDLTPNSPSSLVNISLTQDGQDPVEWTSASTQNISSHTRWIREVERYFPVERIGANLWRDHAEADQVSLDELMYRYAGQVPAEISDPGLIPKQLRSFLDDTAVHLIETQRLLAILPEDSMHPPGRTVGYDQSTVVRFSDDLTRRIREALAANSRQSQELDRTFPRRILGAPLPDSISDEQIRTRYVEQQDIRKRLAEIAILDRSAEMDLPDQRLEGWQRLVLWTYLEDSESKLATFQDLLSRVSLLQDIINSRFLFKDLVIDAESGFTFRTDEGDQVGPTQLSSGEQHELVLLYDLLFNVQPGTTVLVDEPEISLHVTWQQAFLTDIQKIASLADLRFIVATHSPQIIHKWWDRARSLYDPAAKTSDNHA